MSVSFSAPNIAPPCGRDHTSVALCLIISHILVIILASLLLIAHILHINIFLGSLINLIEIIVGRNVVNIELVLVLVLG